MNVTVAIDLPFDEVDVQSVSNMAQEGGWTLSLIHVVRPVVVGSPVGIDGFGAVIPPIETSTVSQVAELETVAEALRSNGLEVTTEVRVGVLPDTILDAAESASASMILAPATQHHFADRVMLGSVLSGLIKTSDRPVLVLPAHKRVKSGFDAALDRLHHVADRSDEDVDLDEVNQAVDACRAVPDSKEEQQGLHAALDRLAGKHPELLIAANQLRFVLFFNGV